MRAQDAEQERRRPFVVVRRNFLRVGRMIVFPNMDGSSDWKRCRGVLGTYQGIGRLNIGWTRKGTYS